MNKDKICHSPSNHNYPVQGSLSKINFASTYQRAQSRKRFFKLNNMKERE